MAQHFGDVSREAVKESIGCISKGLVLNKEGKNMHMHPGEKQGLWWCLPLADLFKLFSMYD